MRTPSELPGAGHERAPAKEVFLPRFDVLTITDTSGIPETAFVAHTLAKMYGISLYSEPRDEKHAIEDALEVTTSHILHGYLNGPLIVEAQHAGLIATAEQLKAENVIVFPKTVRIWLRSPDNLRVWERYKRERQLNPDTSFAH